MKIQRNPDKLVIRIKNTSPVVFAVAFAALGLAQATWAAGVNTPNPNLPPDIGAYYTPAGVHATFNGPGLAIVLQDIAHQPFAYTTVRTVVGVVNEREDFDSSLTGLISVNGSPTQPAQATGPVTTEVFGKIGNVTGTFNTEMLSMNLSGTSPFGPFMIRESPTLASVGQTTITDIGGGLYHIDSFFDVFTELSIDGGQTWMPQSDGPSHVELMPEPGSLGLMLTFGALAVLRRRK